MERQLTVTHNIDIRLRELAEATILGALTAPDLLDLVALERKVQLVGVLNDVARERHRQVKVQAHALVLGSASTRRRSLESLQAIQHVDLLRRLALSLELFQCFDRSGFDAREAMQFEHAPQLVKDVHLDDAPLGEPFGETGQGRASHKAFFL